MESCGPELLTLMINSNGLAFQSSLSIMMLDEFGLDTMDGFQ
jgi:hypothetical protein